MGGLKIDDVYFICADTNKNEVWSGYRLADIFASLKEARCSNIVIIMDMCRKNNTKPILSENYLRRLEPLSSWLIIANETATRDEDDIQGPLTKMIFDAQKEKADLNKDGLVTLRELIAWIKKNISSANSLNIIYPNLDSKLLEYPLSNK